MPKYKCTEGAEKPYKPSKCSIISGVFARRHPDDPEMIELYSRQSQDKIIVWACMHSDMLQEMRGRITPEDLDNHEYEILIHFPGGYRK